MSVEDLLGDGADDIGLPADPDESVWPYLDAAARCIERFGWQRTSVKDVAREAGVERTTVYRHVGSMDEIFRLLVARELHVLMAAVPATIPEGISGPEFVVELVAASVEHALAHPVVAKVLADEPEVVGAFLSRGISELIDRVATTVGPVVGAAMDAGFIARRDPTVVTEWIVRTALSLLIAPPPVELRDFLREVLEPTLRVTPDSPRKRGANRR
jgi:AcrR family transcriptional regulator